MQIWGKVLGALFGFMLTKSPIGAIIGAIIGHRFDKSLGFNFDGLHQKTEQDRQGAFLYTSFSVMGHIAKAKGRVTEHEIQFASQYMTKLGLTGDLRQQAQDAFREGKTSGFPLKERLRKFKRICGNRHDLRLMFLEIQIQVAFSDGDLDAKEREVLHTTAKLLGYSARQLDKLLEMIIASADFHQQAGQSHQQFNGSNASTNAGQLDNAYKILGVSKDASKGDIKKAYRKLMSQHHPDKLIAKGLPPAMMEAAKEKTQDIQAAYDLITKQA